MHAKGPTGKHRAGLFLFAKAYGYCSGRTTSVSLTELACPFLNN